MNNVSILKVIYLLAIAMIKKNIIDRNFIFTENNYPNVKLKATV